MSFGVGIGDIVIVAKLAKQMVQNCRHAPKQFSEASRVSETLYLMLDGLKTECEDKDSPLHKNERTRTDFAIHFRNCQNSLKPLADLISNHESLATSSIRVSDRIRFSKKDYLEYRSNLAFYVASLSEFLQMVGLGSLGRIERNVEDINERLPALMNKIDQMYAEFRIMGDKESIFSDHTNDDKLVWKTFRAKLREAGFASNVLREYESDILDRIEELAQLSDVEDSESNETSSENSCSSSMIDTVEDVAEPGTTTLAIEDSAELKASDSSESLQSFASGASASEHPLEDLVPPKERERPMLSSIMIQRDVKYMRVQPLDVRSPALAEKGTKAQDFKQQSVKFPRHPSPKTSARNVKRLEIRWKFRGEGS